MIIRNIFSPPATTSEEVFETILKTENCTVERIVSTGQATPPGSWYDQERDEWVILLTGSAGLLFEPENTVHTLKPGDYVFIPAHTRHRVAWTDVHANTVWLAVHLGQGAGEQ